MHIALESHCEAKARPLDVLHHPSIIVVMEEDVKAWTANHTSLRYPEHMHLKTSYIPNTQKKKGVSKLAPCNQVHVHVAIEDVSPLSNIKESYNDLQLGVDIYSMRSY